MFCSNCGKENDKNNKFCYSCGNELVIKNEVKSGNEETSLILGIICLASSFFVNIFCFIPGIISIIYAKKYKRESGKLGVGFGLSLGGMIFSFIVLLLTILLFVFILNVATESVQNNYDYNISDKYLDNLSKI